jgi:hypothetical protein
VYSQHHVSGIWYFPGLVKNKLPQETSVFSFVVRNKFINVTWQQICAHLNFTALKHQLLFKMEQNLLDVDYFCYFDPTVYIINI